MNFNELNKPAVWSILFDSLEAMLRGSPDPDKAAEMAIRFTETPTELDDFMLRDGVAIIPVNGTIFKRGSFWSYFFSGVPLTALTQILSAAVADSDVQSILLDIDSPGGQVSGTDAFSDLVYRARQKKPVVAYANGVMASAAYWIGSAANRVIVERTAQVGSIGVLYMHHDWSKYDANLGLKRTVVASGKYKAVGNDAEPLSDDHHQIIQAELDQVYGLFIDTISRNRGVSSKQVLENMADGRIFIGQQAVDAGLADAVGTFQDAFRTASAMIPDNQTAIRPARSVQKPMGKILHTQTRNSDVERIMALLSLRFGEDAATEFQTIVDTGVTPEQYRAIGPPSTNIVTPEIAALNKAKSEMLAAIQAAGAENPGCGPLSGGGNDFMNAVAAVQKERNCSKTKAIQIVAKQQPELHKAYIQRHNPGMNIDFSR